ITRKTCENLFDSAFELARRRKARGRKGKVTCVDKANVFKSMAFFRKIFGERAALHPDIPVSYSYVDAQALDLVRQPWNLDILVMENMFGDILSDMGGGLVGGMGMAPCAELGLTHGLFQPAHGSAPDIAGTGKANPTATLLSAALMLDWLGNKHDVPEMVLAAETLDTAIYDGFASKRIQPYEFGGTDETAAIAETVIDFIQNPLEARAFG
ncbi:MAG: isocitrate/isopropylmalate family dehydrogenase, partial [Methyloligellaceae bacterium]